MRRTALLLLGPFAALAGCTDPVQLTAGPPQPGVLQLLSDRPPWADGSEQSSLWRSDPATGALVPHEQLVAPDTVSAGERFQVVVRTIGESGCWHPVSQSVRFTDDAVVLTPEDAHSGAPICTEMLLHLEHATHVRLAQSGEWRLRVNGRRVRAGEREWEEPVWLEKMLVVR